MGAPAGTVPADPGCSVDNEPEPFWNGDDQDRRAERWRAEVGFDPAWGAVEPAGELNGSSGRWVDRQVLGPLGLTRQEVWITDCLTTYRRSVPGHGRIRDTYNPLARDMGLPTARLAEHPDEEGIVAEALAERHRLLEELERARPARPHRVTGVTRRSRSSRAEGPSRSMNPSGTTHPGPPSP